jgi:hypothetical protein
MLQFYESENLVFLPTSSFPFLKVKDFDIDKWNPTKLFVVANVTE